MSDKDEFDDALASGLGMGKTKMGAARVEWKASFQKAMESGPPPELENLVEKIALDEAKLKERVLIQLCGSRENAADFVEVGAAILRRVSDGFDKELVVNGKIMGIFRREFVGASVVYKFEPVK